MTTQSPPRLTYLQDGAVQVTPIPPFTSTCDCYDGAPAVLRVYGSDQPVWTAHRPFEYAELCESCGPWAVSTAVLQRSHGGSLVLVEVASDVWSRRDDTDGEC